MTQISALTQATWTALFRAQTHARNQAEAALKAAKLPNLEVYDILWELEQAGRAGLRPYQLQERLLLPQYGVSRRLDNLQRQGLIDRRNSAEDGRGFVVYLTDKGRQTRTAIWQHYAPVIRQVIDTPLSQAEQDTLQALLSRLV